MRRFWPLVLLLAVGGMAAWMGLYPVDWENWLGFSKYDYFTAGTNYAFASGPGPMFLTAIGLSTIIAGLWHHLSCHVDSCQRIARYPLAGGQYKVCRVHLPSDHPAKQRLEAHHIHHAHQAHKDRLRSAAYSERE